MNNRAQMLAGKIDFHMGGNMLQAFNAVEQEVKCDNCFTKTKVRALATLLQEISADYHLHGTPFGTQKRFKGSFATCRAWEGAAPRRLH